MEYEMLLLACVQRTLDGVRKELRSQEAAADYFDHPAFQSAKLKLLSNSLRTFWCVKSHQKEINQLLLINGSAGAGIIDSQSEV